MAVQAVVAGVIHKLINLLTSESEIFVKVKDEVEKVMVQLGGIQTNLNNADQYQQQSDNMDGILVEYLGKVYCLEDDIESFVIAQTRLKRMAFVKKHIFELKLCRQVPDEMHMHSSGDVPRFKAKMKLFLQEIQKSKNGMPLSAPARLQGSDSLRQHEQPWEESDVNYYRPTREETIFKKDAEKLLKQLISNSKPLQIISVFGDVGIGKAAHVKTIFNRSEVKKKFPCHALVSIPTECSVRHLMATILQQLNSSEGAKEKLTDEDLIKRLQEFSESHKYLIVINDIKSLHLLKQLRGALSDGHNGSRVVITTPDEGCASFADESSRYHFKPLDVDDGLMYFSKKVWGQRGSPYSAEYMEDLKNKIAESCKGTPLRIAMLAGLVSIRLANNQYWSSVFQKLDLATNSPSFDIFAFCYNDLPLHLKLCFLYLGLFPKGFEIPVRRLLPLWLAEGFVMKPNGGIIEPSEGIVLEDIVEGYLEELVKRNIVEISKRRSDESPKKCRMIVALHDIFCPRAVKIGLFHLHKKSRENSNAAAAGAEPGAEPPLRVRRVVEYSNIRTYRISAACNQNLRSYISFNGRQKDMPADEVRTFLHEIIGTRGFGLLKVLDLEGVYRPRLPENLGNLLHLRYLGLRWTFLDTLPSSLGALLHLETLDIKHTHITILPPSIWNMKHLRHLCLNGARLNIPVQSTKHTDSTQLQTLRGLFVDERIARNIGFTLSRFTNLRKLDLTRESSSTVTTTTITSQTTTTTTTTRHSSSYEEINVWIGSLSSLRSLRLRSKDKMGQPSELIVKPFSLLKNLSQLYLLGHLRKPLAWYQIPPGLKALTLSVSILDKDPMPTLSQLPSLMVLRLLAASYVGEEMHCPENGFPSLQILKLWQLEKLKVLTVHQGTIQNLHTLEIRCCKELEELPVTLLHIRSFENLILTDMPKSFASAIRKKKAKYTKIVENVKDA